VVEELDAEGVALDAQTFEPSDVSRSRRDAAGFHERREHQLGRTDAISDRGERLGIGAHDVAACVARTRERHATDLTSVVEADEKLTDDMLVTHQLLDDPRRVVRAIDCRQFPTFGA
jgi:hypothetical protein